MTRMETEVTAARKPHVLVVPYPGQGHINPALEFAKYLASKGVRITFITTKAVTKSARSSLCGLLTIDNVSDGSEDVKGPESIEGYFKRFKAVFSKNLARFIDEQTNAAQVIVYDSTMPWVLDIAHERGLRGASFFTQSCAVSAAFYHLKQETLRFPYEDSVVSLPSLPALGAKDLPSFLEFMDSKRTIPTLMADQFSNLEKVDWIFLNTFNKLENEVVDWMASRYPIKTIGPTFSLLQTEKKLFNSKNHTISLLEPACTEWLDSRETGSVVYVSFGSIASLSKKQMEEIACGLMMSNCYFLWVVRPLEADKLPEDFTSLASEKGLIVGWCKQPEVLAHRAIACFLTHCGWNSTLEALSCGVPLIAMPQWVDQQTNSKFIEDVWGVGVRVKRGEDGIVGREEIAMCIKEVTEEDRGMELKRNACVWKELANEAVEKGGTSANNIEDFVSKLMCISG
ncbi:UNVERIFIED_CONTAM: UDP glycosyltransferase 9 [Sesamum radiatum]|uniref:Glycosyltransferase n=1 Tax=Sesamum radiatum TaxID=300843 RepID=A0AAW2QFG2_SESRA